jgi:hypothetical protein
VKAAIATDSGSRICAKSASKSPSSTSRKAIVARSTPFSGPAQLLRPYPVTSFEAAGRVAALFGRTSDGR